MERISNAIYMEELVKKLSIILKSELKDWDIRLYSDIKDFQSLWEINDKKISKESKQIVVVWDGFPDNASSLVSLKEFITPMDWAFAYSKKHIDDQNLNIIIFDVCSHIKEKFEYNNEEVKKFHEEVLMKMQEWVQFYSFNKKVFKNSQNPLKILVNKKSLSKSPSGNTRKDQPTALLKAWKKMIDDITNNEEHLQSRHSMNNILVPILLAEPTFEEKDLTAICNKYVHSTAFYKIFKFCDIEICDTNIDNQIDANLINKAEENTKIILMDDQASNGWADLLKGWMANSNIEVGSEDKVSFITDKLKAMIKQDPPLKLNLTEDDNPVQILLFDLHLFADNQKSEQEKYFQDTLNLCRKLKPKPNNFSLDDQYINNLQRRLNDKLYNDRLTDYLTLLPRLIAEIDPYIPIIIFSVTERSRLYELVRKYKNIEIFKKPNIPIFSKVGEEIDDPRKIKNQFINKVNWALDFSNTNTRLYNFFNKFSVSNARLPELNFSPFNDTDNDELRVDLFLDEKGVAGVDEEFVVGGIYVVGPMQDRQIWGSFEADKSTYDWEEWNELIKYQKKIRDRAKKTHEEKNRLREINGQKKKKQPTHYLKEGEKRSIRRLTGDCLANRDNWPNPTSIHAIKLTSKNNQNNNNFKQGIENVALRVIKGVKSPVNQIIFEEVFNRCITNNHFIDEIFQRIFEQYALRIENGNRQEAIPLNARFNDEFNGKCEEYNRQLFEVICQQYENSQIHHKDVLNNLIKLFLNLLMPILEKKSGKKIQKINVYYATVIREVHFNVAAELDEKGICGYDQHFDNLSPIRRTYIISPDSLERDNFKSAYDIRLLGIPISDIKIRNPLRFFADYVVSGEPNIVQCLYEYPGMEANLADLKLFQINDLCNYLYQNNYEKALHTIMTDKAWSIIKKVSSDENNTARSYICKLLAIKANKIL